MHLDIPEDLHHRLLHFAPDRGIPTMADVRRRTGSSTPQAWHRWHGRANVGLHLAHWFEAPLEISLTVFLALARGRPPAAHRPGRPRTWSSATPLAEEPTP